MWEQAYITARTRERVAALRSEYPPEFARDQRRRYLLRHYRNLFSRRYLASRRYIEDTVTDALIISRMLRETENIVSKVYLSSLYTDCIATLLRFQKACYYRRHPGRERRFLRDRIEDARMYPFGNLLTITRGQALCPFHGDKTPSLTYYRNDNHVYCHSCHKAWDTIQFVMDRDGLSFVQAVEFLT